MNDLQDLVDALAAELGRPVGLDDRRFRSIAYSSHVEELDQVRLSSILQRKAPDEVTRFLSSLNIEDVDDHLRIPARPELGMASRVCLPVRFVGSLLGYLWLFDEPDRVGSEGLCAARRCVGEAAAIMFRQRRLDEHTRAQELRLLRALLGLDPEAEPDPAGGLRGSGLLARTALAVVAVLEALGEDVDDPVRVRLAAAGDRLRRSAAPHHVLSLPEGDAVVLLVLGDDAPALDRRLADLHRYASESLADATGVRPVVGAGAVSATLAGAPERLVEARRAAGLARALPGEPAVVRWEDLGAYRTIAMLLQGADPAGFVPASLAGLAEVDDADTLLPTLRTWLESGCDAKRTAEQLFLHRSTLYDRIHRIEEITGADLRSGDARLELHVGLRLLALARDEGAASLPARPPGSASATR
jgi:hypothetical protein